MKGILKTVLEFLGVTAFVEEGGVKKLTEDQKQKMIQNFGEAFTTKFIADLEHESNGDGTGTATEDSAQLTELKNKLAASEQELANLRSSTSTFETDKADLMKTINEQKALITILSASDGVDPKPTHVSKGTETMDEKNDKFLFGIQQPFMAIDDAHPYNQRAYASLMEKHGIVIPFRKAASMDYESLKTDLGDYFRVRKQEQIQSFLQKLPSLETIFKVESGYQDQAVLINLFLTDDFSQAGNTGSTFENVVKGGYKFEPEILRMFDVMFAHKFTDLSKLEKTWMGYLNREGSSTMKWSFIQYILVETGKKLHNEREIRRVRGKRINPTLNVPGTALGASDGMLEFIKKQIALFKIKPFAIGEWTESNIAEYIRQATAMVPIVIRDTGTVVLYMSPDALTAYWKNLELLYGVNQDYTANIKYVKEYPNVKIETVPNMGVSKRMVWTVAGNFSLFEDQPNEMFNFSLEQQDWSLKVWSNWKESFWAYLIGKKHASAAEMPDDYSTQLIFCNDVDEPANYYVPMLADDTTPSVAQHTSIVSVANTVATAITDIDDAEINQEVRLKCGNSTNPITIAAANKFSLLTAAWNPAVGDVLILKKRSDGKFIEIDRQDATSKAIAIAADDTTPDVAAGDTFVTNANTAATAITTLDNAITGRVYTIYGAGSTNASTIANSGNFVLTAAMTLSAGKWIQLQKAANGKFYEINRG